jgi:hypothetical protein
MASVLAAEVMFDTLVGFFLEQLPFPFAKLIGSRVGRNGDAHKQAR